MAIYPKIVYNKSIMAQSRKAKKQVRQYRLSTGCQLVLGLFVLLSVLTFSGLYLLEVASQPLAEGKTKAKEIAKQYAHLTEISEVQLYHGQESYYRVKGTNQDLESVYVLVPNDSNEIYLIKAGDGLPKEKAEELAKQEGASEIEDLVVGIWNKKPVWEVKSGTSYFLIDFKTGELLERKGL